MADEKKVEIVIRESVPKGLSDEEAGFELSDLYDPRNRWTPEQKISAVQAFMITGSSIKASKLTGIPDATIRWWKTESVWWPSLMEHIRKEKQDELDGQLTGLMEKAFGELEDRIEHGDEVLTKDGGVVRKKMSGKDLATTGAIIYDKRALARTGDVDKGASKDDAINKLAERFNTFFEQMQNSGMIAKPIEAEVIRKEDKN